MFFHMTLLWQLRRAGCHALAFRRYAEPKGRDEQLCVRFRLEDNAEVKDAVEHVVHIHEAAAVARHLTPDLRAVGGAKYGLLEEGDGFPE